MYPFFTVEMLVLIFSQRTVCQPHFNLGPQEVLQCWDIKLSQVPQHEGEVSKFAVFVVNSLQCELAELLRSEVVAEGVVDHDGPQVGQSAGEEVGGETGQTDSLHLQSLQTVPASQGCHDGLQLEL